MRNLWLLSVLFIVGCSTSVNHYSNTTPELKLEEFYDGKLTAYGMVQNRSGEVLRRFRVDMEGTWEDNKGRLDETFFYDDGEQQQRTWYLEKRSNGQYSGTADDVVKPARGETNGYALNWRYTLTIPVDDNTWDINFDDWMYLIDEKRLINRAQMKKWGFTVGEVTLWIEKH